MKINENCVRYTILRLKVTILQANFVDFEVVNF